MSGKQCHSNYLFYVGMSASLGIWGASLRLTPALFQLTISKLKRTDPSLVETIDQ